MYTGIVFLSSESPAWKFRSSVTGHCHWAIGSRRVLVCRFRNVQKRMAWTFRALKMRTLRCIRTSLSDYPPSDPVSCPRRTEPQLHQRKKKKQYHNLRDPHKQAAHSTNEQLTSFQKLPHIMKFVCLFVCFGLVGWLVSWLVGGCWLSVGWLVSSRPFHIYCQ
jgi:hypothetical protein